MSITFKKRPWGYCVESLTSKFASTVLNLPGLACPSGPHRFIRDSIAQAKVKHSKGNFSTVLFLMNFGDGSHQGLFGRHVFAFG